MEMCDGCGTEFDDSVELFPRLIVNKEAQVARKLAEKKGNDMLCLPCWLEAVDAVDPKQLAMLLLGMLKKNTSLEERLFETLGRVSVADAMSGVLEKARQRKAEEARNPYSRPWVSGIPHMEPQHIFVHTTDRTTIGSEPHFGTVAGRITQDTAENASFVAGRWASFMVK